jgi:acetylornithine deacetylase
MNSGNEAVVIRPGDMQTAHSARECVPVAELEEWTAALGELFGAK